jgi:hyperosmotically inducible periplasmic protein
MRSKNKVGAIISAAAAVAAVLSLGGCDWIQSLWKSDQPAPQAQQAPAAGKIEIAKSAEAPKPAEPEKPAIDENKELAGKVKSALGADPALKMLAIDAGASDGVVTLYGTADNKKNRDKAARIAAGVPGVKSVKNELVIVAGS